MAAGSRLAALCPPASVAAAERPERIDHQQPDRETLAHFLRQKTIRHPTDAANTATNDSEAADDDDAIGDSDDAGGGERHPSSVGGRHAPNGSGRVTRFGRAPLRRRHREHRAPSIDISRPARSRHPRRHPWRQRDAVT